ncbi:MAG: ABC transporter ATP-binding protein [Candidatus Protistobacter heckmanni]|nr:ABC transporter ATP-binding protein [Candidatus Protistobacter heckmanni]
MLAYATLDISDAAAKVTAGSICFDGADLLANKGAALKNLRGRDVAIIFQNPRAALNPIRSVGRQIEDVLARHTDLKGSALRERALACLAEVRIPDPERRFDAYPFELSGGMCQPAMIAMALACKPRLLIADEPTTGLDVTTQAAIMRLIVELGRERGMATLLITHDLGLARAFCDRLAVMHAGHIVETGKSDDLFTKPAHPYTTQLLRATPIGRASLSELASIPGNRPDLRRKDLPACRFAERCTRRDAACEHKLTLAPLDGAPDHTIACHHPVADGAGLAMNEERLHEPAA